MEITITIRDTATGGATTGLQVGATTGAPPSTPGGSEQAAYEAGPGPSMRGQTPSAGPQGMSARMGSPLQPPEDVLRAAAASGAFNGGPAPMLADASFDTTAGAPQAYVGSGREASAMAAQGAQDQSGGAAPGAEQMVPAVTISQPPEGGQR